MDPIGISVVRADESYGYAKYYYYDGPTVYIEVTAIDSSDNKWRIRGRESWGDKEVYLSGKGVGTFSFDSDDNYSYIFQIQNWNGDWVNTTNAYGDTEENSIINVNFDSSSGGDGWEDDGGGSGTGGGSGGGYGSGSGTLYFDATRYEAKYAVEYSYDSDTFYIDNVQVKLAQLASAWWEFNLTVKINGFTISNRSSNHLIDTFDWYDLDISGSADITDKVEVTLTGSAIHGNYQFNVASPTTQTVVISDDDDDDGGSSGGDSGGDSGGNSGSSGEDSPDGSLYILVRQGEGTKLTVTRTYVDNDAYYDEGDYIGELVNGELFEDEYGAWYKYRAWNDDYFTIEAEALPGYTIDTHYDKDGFMWYYAVSGMEYNVGYDGNSAWNFDPQDFGEVARIYTTATKNGSSGGDGSFGTPRTLYIQQGEGTYIVVIFEASSHYGERTSFYENTSATVYYNENDIFYIVVEPLDGYELSYHKIDGYNLNVPYILENIELYQEEYDGLHYFKLASDGDARIISTATKNDSSDNGSSAKKGAYIGIDNVARKINKMYIGIDNVARKIKKAYIGIGGVARPCWSDRELVYYGTVTDLSAAKYNLAATHVGDYALFGGGVSSSKLTVDAYSSSLVKSTPDSLQNGYGTTVTSSHIGNYAVFRTGEAITAYNNSLTKTTKTGLGSRCSMASSSNGSYILFTDGELIEFFNSSLTLVSSVNLDAYHMDLSATHVGNYIIMAGGFNGEDTIYDDVYAFDKSLTQKFPTDLSVARCRLAATHVGNYALFGGGASSYSDTSDNGVPHSTVDAYNASLTKTTSSTLSKARYGLAATHVGDYALFGGGTDAGAYEDYNMYDTVDAYNTSLTKTTPSTLSKARNNLAATHVGNYALFGGGMDEQYAGSGMSTVDVYVII